MPSTNKLSSRIRGNSLLGPRSHIARFLYTFCGIFASFGVVTMLALTGALTNASAVGNNSNSNTVSATLPGSVAIRLLDSTATTEISSLDFNLTPTAPGTSFNPSISSATQNVVVDVATSNPTGYKLYMQSNYQDSSSNYTTNLVHTTNGTPDADISDVIPTSTSASTLYWNYINPLLNAGIEDPSSKVTSTIPAHGSPDKLDQYFTTTNSRQTAVSFNVSVDTTIVSGTYENQLLFSAVGNPTTLNYSISFDTDGGTMVGEDITESAAAGTHSITIPNNSDYIPTKTGYAFSYWEIVIPEGSSVTASCAATINSSDILSNSGTGNNGESVEDTRSSNVCYPGDDIVIHSSVDSSGDFVGDVGLKANHVRDSYELTVNPNGGVWEGSSSSQIILGDEGDTKTIPNPSSTPTYTITYNANGQGASYTGSPTTIGTTFKSWSVTSTSEEESRHGSFDSTTSTYTFGAGNDTMTANYSTNSFKLPNITKSGYKCGWAKDSPSGTKYAGGVDINIELTVTGDTTFYAYCTTANTIANISYMQNMTTAICDNTFIGNTVTLRDNRDSNTYTVKKLLDGKCWMTQNLRLIGNRTLTSANSDVTKNTTWNPIDPSTASDTCYLNMCAYYGNNTTYGAYYNYHAAIAENVSSYAYSEAGEASQSICSKGWRLPSYAEHETLSRSYALSNDLITSSSGPNLTLAGQKYGSLNSVGVYGFYISNYHATYYTAAMFVNYYSYPRWGTSLHRTMQASVRCVAK